MTEKISIFKRKELSILKENWFYSACFPFLILLWVGTKYFNIPMYDVVADPAEICQKGPYLGFLSQAGLLAWLGGISCCFFTLSLAKKLFIIPLHWQRFILSSGLFSMLLGLDDWIQIHEYLPKIILSNSQINQNIQSFLELVIYLFYFIVLIIYFNSFKILIYKTRYYFFIAAISFFALSNFVDIFVPETINWHFFTEEGSKFLGIVSWSTYHWYICKDIIGNKLSPLTRQHLISE